MPSRIAQAHALDNPLLMDQISGSLMIYAVSVLNEDPATPQHESRVQYANFIFQDPRNSVNPLFPTFRTIALLNDSAGSSNGSGGSPCQDSDVDAMVAENYNRFKVICGYPDA